MESAIVERRMDGRRDENTEGLIRCCVNVFSSNDGTAALFLEWIVLLVWKTTHKVIFLLVLLHETH